MTFERNHTFTDFCSYNEERFVNFASLTRSDFVQNSKQDRFASKLVLGQILSTEMTTIVYVIKFALILGQFFENIFHLIIKLHDTAA